MSQEEKFGEVTKILHQIGDGNKDAVNNLMPLVYDEFHKMAQRYMNRESSGHTLQPTALVSEAYLKIVDQKNVNWQGRSHFFAVGAQAMRRILVDHARKKKSEKRGGGQINLELNEEIALTPNKDEDIIAVDDALKALEQIDERQARIVEMRFFGGLSVQEVAEVLNVSKRTVEAEWTMIKAWLRRELSEG